MGLIIRPDKMLKAHLGITLGCRQPPMTQEFLHAAQVRAGGQQMGGKGMAQAVRRNRDV